MSTGHRSLSFALPLILLLPWTALQAATLHLSSGPVQTTLIELYTSQGCSSCPPAERWMSSLKQDPRLWKSVIPVAFHVDYWNYLGWNDPWSRPDFSERQRRYREEGGLSTVYTPGFVVNGKEWRRWFGVNHLPPSRQNVGTLSLHVDGTRLEADFSPSLPRQGRLSLNIVILGSGMHTAISRGENAGKTLAQDFVVLEHIQAESRDRHWQLRLPALPPGAAVPRLAIVAWVSPDRHQAPLQSVGGWLSPSR